LAKTWWLKRYIKVIDMKKWLLNACLFFSLTAVAQLNLVPAPSSIKVGQGNFIWPAKLVCNYNDNELKKEAQYLNKMLEERFHYPIAIQNGMMKNREIANTQNKFIELSLSKKDMGATEGYELRITDETIFIDAPNNKGIFYGIQTLLQLIPINDADRLLTGKVAIPQLYIKDEPRFAYRGMHLDVARHFQPVSFVKKYIDYLAAYKLNRFHWHLTDDQGCRIEIKKYPRLTSVGGYRNGTIIGRYPGTGNDGLRYGGFYTQEEIREVVQYAAERHIDVIPEIEMPGHASAAIAAYPELSCFPSESTKVLESTPWAGISTGKQVQQTWGVFEDVFSPTEFTFHFLENVINEVVLLFPSKYIHIGGDECPKESWKRSTFAQALIKEKNLKDEHGLQSYFIQRIEKYINNKGKKIIGWDEILEGGLAPNATVMSWRGEEGGIIAAKDKHDVIMTPGGWMYFDHSQSNNEDSVTIGGYTSLEKVYSYDPIPAALSADESKYILGAQANVWTEYIKNEEKVAYMIFPRMAALAEVLWTPKAKKNWKDFESRLPSIFSYYKKNGINYSNAYYDLQSKVIETANKGIAWQLSSLHPEGTIFYKTNNSVYKKYEGPVVVTQNTALQAALQDANGNNISNLVQQTFLVNKASGKKATLTQPASKGYAGSGAFTLVDGVQNTMGMSKSSQFIGFSGKDLEAIVDLDSMTNINEIIFHAFEQTGSWIYRPNEVSFYSSEDGVDFKLLETVTTVKDSRHLNYKCRINTQTRFIKILAKNKGTIGDGLPGAGNQAWLFAHEIEVN
jgi:hexosaminidase